MKKLCTILALLVLITALLAGCGSKAAANANAGVREGWKESNGPSSFKVSFDTFTGQETKKINVKEGQVLTFDFNSDIKDGSVVMSVVDPKGLQILSLEQNKKAVKQVSVSKTTIYTLQIIGDKAKGSIDINWSLK